MIYLPALKSLSEPILSNTKSAVGILQACIIYLANTLFVVSQRLSTKHPVQGMLRSANIWQFSSMKFTMKSGFSARISCFSFTISVFSSKNFSYELYPLTFSSFQTQLTINPQYSAASSHLVYKIKTNFFFGFSCFGV